MITVSEVIKNSCLKKYPIVCGLTGLENEVLRSGIIDYEFSIEGFIDKHHSFQYGDFLITSLMFTGGNEDKLMTMLEKLIELGVSGLAIKNVFFKSIPEKALEYCDANNFPILLFDNGVYFEDIVKDIDRLLEVSDWINKVEHQISLMIGTELSRYEAEGISKDMGIGRLPYVKAFWLSPKQIVSQNSMKKVVKDYSGSSHRDKNSYLFKYRQNYLVLITGDKYDAKRLEDGFKSVLGVSGFKTEDYRIGISGVKNSISELDSAIKESQWSCQVAELLDEEVKEYSELGTWAVASANYKSKHMLEYMKGYLGPIISDSSESAADLLSTLVAMVLSKGSGKLAAKRLNIHDNTYRYRINKIREKIDKNSNDYEFFENASFAIKIYLLAKNDRLI